MELKPTDVPRFSGVMHVYTGNRFGGIETMLVTMARHSLFEGQSYGLMFCGRLYEELTAANVDVVDLGGFRARQPWQAFRVRRRLRAALESRGVHTVVTHMTIPYALAAPVVGDRLLVYFAHEFHRGRHWSERWARLSRRPDAALASSKFTAQSVPAVFPALEPTVVFCTTDLGRPGSPGERESVRQELRTPSGHHVLITTARLTPYKGHEVLIEALGQLRARSDWTAWIAGGPQTRDEARLAERLQARVTALDITERVRFLGERRDVARLLSSADVHCQANVGPEPFGICFVEALWAGLPVVTSALGGALEVVTPELGELVLPGNPTALAEALGKCMDDPEKARSARALGPARAQALCAPEAFAERLAGALVAARKSAPR